MKKVAALLAFFPFIALAQPRIMLVMHGGAGTITRASMTPDVEKQYREKLEEALRGRQESDLRGSCRDGKVSARDDVRPRRRSLRDAGRARSRHDIAALYKYRGMTVEAAGNAVINHKLKDANGDGGAIVLDAKGNFAMPFNSEGMYRGWIGADGVPHVLIYKD
jgi:isoaspartyl peptidase/L-asparaginase-like protein (Ntn-hydrolase superfamily)